MHDRRSRFEAQVMPHLNAAYRFARWLSPSSGDADDLVQEAILRAFRAFDGLRGTDAKAWLLAIVRNCHSTAVRQRRRHVFVPLPDDFDGEDGNAMISAGASPEEESMKREAELKLNRLLSELPEEHREVWWLREIEEMGYREIAGVTGVPIGTVMSRLSRARASLRVLWRDETQGVRP